MDAVAEGKDAGKGRLGAVSRTLFAPVRSFSPRTLPALARANYRRELLAALFLPFLLVVVDSNVIGVLVKNAYEGQVGEGVLNLVVAILAASTSAANIISFVWVRLANGVHKIRFINALQVAMIVTVGLIALVPRNALGLWLIVACVVFARVIWSGFITVRSTVWGVNYGPRVRARVTGKLATVQTGMLAILGIGLGAAMETDERAFRIFFPVGCALALISVWSWSRIRVRGHAALRRAELARTGEHAPTFHPGGVWRILRTDTRYARFLRNLSLLGLGNLMLSPIVMIVAKDEFGMGYLGNIIVSQAVPLGMMPFTIPLWARLLDHLHVIHFRALHSWTFVLAATLATLAVLLHSEVLLYASSVCSGIGYGGGVLAWNIGHLDFAPRGMETQYMGVHQTLNGVRGLAAPFLGVGLYQVLGAIEPTLTWGAFAACTLLTIIGAAGFHTMARATTGLRQPRPVPVETAPPAKTGIG